MAADSYCAICGASLGITALQTGLNTDRAKRIRKEKIDFGLRKRADQTDGQYYHEDSDSDVPDMETYYIEHRYDPDVMACRDTTLPNYDRFIEHVRLVMYDPNIKTSSQYFISGQAEVDDFGWGTMKGGGHPDRPDEQFENVMYMEYEDDQTKSFPCHGLCLQIAAKAILGKPDSRLLDPEVLYRVMCDEFHDGNFSSLELDYGDITTGEQFWESEAGEEVSGTSLQHFRRVRANMQAGIVLHHQSSGVPQFAPANAYQLHDRAGIERTRLQHPEDDHRSFSTALERADSSSHGSLGG